MADYGVSAAAGQWLTTGFLLTMAVVIPTTGFLLRRFPLRGLFVFALTSFIIGLLLAVVAPTFAVLLLARLLQAVGTAIVLLLLMTTTLTLVPLRHRGMVIGLNSIVISVGPAIGPTVSGEIVNALSWHWIFAAVMPLAIIIRVLGVLFIKVPSSTRRVAVDGATVVLSALAFGRVGARRRAVRRSARRVPHRRDPRVPRSRLCPVHRGGPGAPLIRRQSSAVQPSAVTRPTVVAGGWPRWRCDCRSAAWPC